MCSWRHLPPVNPLILPQTREMCGPVLIVQPRWLQPEEGEGPAHSLPGRKLPFTISMLSTLRAPLRAHSTDEESRAQGEGLTHSQGQKLNQVLNSRVPFLSITGLPTFPRPTRHFCVVFLLLGLGVIRLLFPPSIPKAPQGVTSLKPWGSREFSLYVQLGLLPALERRTGEGVWESLEGGHRGGLYPPLPGRRLGASR